MTPEQEFDLLKNQAQALREQLEQIEARIQALENTKRNQA
jgi:prefoldin subunit 5